jgi:hypothetical protein
MSADGILPQVNAMVQGAAVMCSLAIGLFFMRFWWKSRDRLFLMFAVAFWIFGINRLMLTFVGSDSEHRLWLYLIRLACFSLIIYAVIDKNRREHRRGNGPSV